MKKLKLKIWWKSLSSAKKGFFIGLSVGIVWAVFVMIGVSGCGWNFMEWRSSLPMCNNGIVQALFYTPYVFAQIAVFYLFFLIPLLPNLTKLSLPIFELFITYLPLIIIIFIFSLLGMIIGKTKGK